MKEPKEIMDKFRYLPKPKDIDAAFASCEKFLSWPGSSQLAEAEIFHFGFWRGCFWEKEKHKELLEILGTDDPEVAVQRVKELAKRAKRRKRDGL